LLLDELEIKHIANQRSFRDWNEGGYNLTTGGYANRVVSAVTRQKLRESTRQSYQNNSNRGFRVGNIPWNKGLTGLTKATQVAWNKGLKNCQTAWNKGKTSTQQYNFSNIKTQEEFCGTKNEFELKFNVSKSTVKRICQSKHSTWIGKKVQCLDPVTLENGQ